MTKDIFPWQVDQWHDLTKCKQLASALLFIGDQGIGKKQFAVAFSSALLCQSNSACGKCHSCCLFKANSHPDLLLIEPEKRGQLIKVDQIRESIAFSQETSFLGKSRIIIINPATAMNTNAANALLKTLEEPPPNTLLILISELKLKLPATIISRCRKVIFNKPSHDIALKWLQSQNILENRELLLSLANGAPLRAKELVIDETLSLRHELYQQLNLLSSQATDPLHLAQALHEKDILVILNLLMLWLQDLLRCKLTDGKAKLINFDYELLPQLAKKLTKEKLLTYFYFVNKSFEHLSNHINLNKQLLLEELFIRWTLYAAR